LEDEERHRDWPFRQVPDIHADIATDADDLPPPGRLGQAH
jgi:hypothetical protein